MKRRIIIEILNDEISDERAVDLVKAVIKNWKISWWWIKAQKQYCYMTTFHSWPTVYCPTRYIKNKSDKFVVHI